MDGDGSFFGLIIQLAVIAFFVWVFWRIFEKAGQPGWAAIIPIYNVIVLLEIVGRPLWWIILAISSFPVPLSPCTRTVESLS